MSNDGIRVNILSERLKLLFEAVHPAYTPREVADAINAQARAKIISADDLSRLQTGEHADPNDPHLFAIARFFDVHIDYLSNRAVDYEAARPEFLASVLDADAGSVALRAQGLSQASLVAVRAVIENARRLEGLPYEE